MERQTLIIIAVVAVLVIAGGTTVGVKVYKSGRPVTNAPAPDGGFVVVLPSVLAAQVGVLQDVYTYARIARSEAGSGNDAEKIAVMWGARNQANVWREDITTAATRGGTGKGHYGAQNAPARWVSTAQDPLASDVALAKRFVAGDFPVDPTGGATKWIHVKTQSVLHERNPQKYKAPDVVLASWSGDGFEIVHISGVDPARFVMLRKASGTLLAQLKAKGRAATS